MVRKIPARKHRGVKDPLLQLARRNACPTINAPPSNPKEQELPKSVLEIQRLCQLANNYDKLGAKKNRHINKNGKNFDLIDSQKLFDKDPKLPGMRRKDKGVPRVIQKPGEDDETYFHRFSAAAREFLNEVELENKHDVQFNNNSTSIKKNDERKSDPKTPNSKKRKQAEIEDSMQQNSNGGNLKNNNKHPRFLKSSKESGTKPNKRQRRKLRKALLKKEEHVDNDDSAGSEEEIDFSSFKDEVKFGEVVHRPPQFTVKPRGSELNSKPGTKDLLLKSIIGNSKDKDMKKQPSKLSNSQKYFLEQERLRVVKAYRDMKANKMKG